MEETLKDTALQLDSAITTYKLKLYTINLGLCIEVILNYILTNFGALWSGQLATVIQSLISSSWALQCDVQHQTLSYVAGAALEH
jgi:hypothetical protein